MGETARVALSHKSTFFNEKKQNNLCFMDLYPGIFTGQEQ